MLHLYHLNQSLFSAGVEGHHTLLSWCVPKYRDSKELRSLSSADCDEQPCLCVSLSVCQLTECIWRVPYSQQPLLASLRQSSSALASLELPESSQLSEIQYLLIEIHSECR